MPEIGGVWYGEHAYEHMRELSAQLTLDESTPTVANEAAVIHAFHEEFPGVEMEEADDGLHVQDGRDVSEASPGEADPDPRPDGDPEEGGA